MIIGLTGPICSGKRSLAEYLRDKYGFIIIDLLFLFQQTDDAFISSPLKPQRDFLDDFREQNQLSTTSNSINVDDVYFDEALLQKMSEKDNDQDAFSFEFYQKKFKGDRVKLIKNVFRKITSDWSRHYVIYPLSSCEEIQIMISRYYFILYELDAPIKQRYLRFKNKYLEQNQISLEEFVDLDDNINFNKQEYSLYKADEQHQLLIKRRFHNADTLEKFHITLDDFKFDDKEHVRPSWDTYFMKFAELAAQRSNCMKRGNGAIIVKDFRIVSTGYNGTPFKHLNCNEGGCRRCNSNVAQGLELDKCKCLHAEESAVIEAGRPRTLDSTIYTTSFPCLLCTKIIIQAGIKRVVYNKNYDSVLSREMLNDSEIELVQHIV